MSDIQPPLPPASSAGDQGRLLNTVGASKWPITLHSGEGALLWDTGGRTYWDFYGGHAVTLIGHGHPRWIEAVTRQAKLLSFCTTIAPVPVRQRAAEALCEFTGMDVAWFVNSGAEANEGALKIARKATGRGRVVAMEEGFHGRTMGALGVTWKYRDTHQPPHGDTTFVSFGDTEALAAAMGSDVAAVILEPIQGLAGVVMPPTGYLQAVEALCKKHGAKLICDEVQSGIGRTGVPLVSRALGIEPDLVTVGKGIGGGFPAAAVLMSRAMADTVKPGDQGTTFGGGPLAAAAVEATLDILQGEGLLDKAVQLERWMKEELQVPGVKEIRGAGAWIAVVLDRPAKPVAGALMAAGFLVGTATEPNTLRLSPPAILPECAVHLLRDALKTVLNPQEAAA